MSWHPNETQAEVVKGVLRGAVRGGAVGAVAAIATGAAVIVTAPASLPVVGGSMLVSAATIARWAGIGAAVGAVTGGTRAYVRKKRRDRKFEEIFGKTKGAYAR